MDNAHIRVLDDVIIKSYKNHAAASDVFRREFTAYRNLWWATPKLIAMYGLELMVERLPAISDFPPHETVKFRGHLYWLLDKVHEAGYWHGNVDVRNVVLDPIRGPLLMNWEFLTEAKGPNSYDIHGPASLGVDPIAGDGDGVFWFGNARTHPYNFWKE